MRSSGLALVLLALACSDATPRSNAHEEMPVQPDGGAAGEGASGAGSESSCLPGHGAACVQLWSSRMGINALTQDAQYVYYSTIPENAEIARIDKTTGVADVLVTLGNDNAFTLLLHEGYLYWSSVETSGMANAKIARVPIAGGTPEVLREGLADEAALAATGDQLYFAQRSQSVLSRMPLAGGEPEELLGQGGDISWLAADGDELFWLELVYLTEQSKQGFELVRADTALANVPEALSTHDLTYNAILTPTHVVWFNAQSGGFYALDRATKAQERLAELTVDPVIPADLVQAASATHVYAITRDHRLVRAPLASGALEELATQLDARDLLVDADYVYAAVPSKGLLRMALPH